MDALTLREKLVPLTEKERRYRDDPAYAREQFRTWEDVETDADGILRFLVEKPQQGTIMRHGLIVPDQGDTVMHPNLTITKQTRYSYVPMHRHAYVELNYVYGGEASMVFADHEEHLNAGDVCIMDSEAVHTVHPAEEHDILLNISLTKDYFDYHFVNALRAGGAIANFLAEAITENTRHDNCLVIRPQSPEAILRLMEFLVCEYLTPDICSTEMLDSGMQMLFIELARSYREDREATKGGTDLSRLMDILAHIERNCATCTLAETARTFGYNPNYLSGMLKKQTGHSFKELVYKSRLERVQFLLANSNMSIDSVAETCGWSNLNQFYKVFKMAFGCTPKEYRAQVT